MDTSVFHSFMSSMLLNLSTVQCSFMENETYSSNTPMALTLEDLANQIENLRISLVSGYDGKERK